jgi:integrase
MKLTKLTVESLPYPETGRRAYRDDKLIGFGVRVNRTTKTYYAERKMNGKSVRISIGTHGQITCEQARAEARKLLLMMSTGRNPLDEKRAEKAKSVTLIEAFNEFMSARKSLKPRTASDYRIIMRKYLADWHDKPLVDVTKDMVAKKHKSLGENHGGAQANYVMRVLRAIFNFAIGQYEDSKGCPIITENPVKRLSQTRAWYRVGRRQTVIKSHELPAFFDGLNRLVETSVTSKAGVVRDYILLLLFTGLRRQEAARVKWEQVDLTARTLTIIEEMAKNREPLTLPLSDYVFDMLKRRHETKENNYVFPGNGEDGYIIEPRRQMAKVAKLSGVSFTLHDLRRTFITIAESLDISAYAVKRLVNHKMSSDVTAGYIIMDVERLREPMQKITDYILEKAEIT